MKPEFELALLQAAHNSLGIYPTATIENGIEIKRTDYQNGWNDAVMKLTENALKLFDWIKTIDPEILNKIEELLIAQQIDIDFLGENEEIKIYLNANDTFYYSCADLEIVEFRDIDSLYGAFKIYGDAGILAWISIRRALEPLKELQTEKFKIALKGLSPACNLN